MTMAYLASMKSKDPSTRVGAVIVGPDNEIRSTGYNGLPRNIKDNEQRYNNNEFKQLASNHAEENAILNCVLIGASARNCTMYTMWMPCSRCAKAIIQSGIKKVVIDENFPGNKEGYHQNWQLSMEISKELLNEAGVELEHFNGPLIQISGMCKGQSYIPNAR